MVKAAVTISPMSSSTDKLVETFASKVQGHGVPLIGDDNTVRLQRFQEKLPNRLPQSFEYFLSRYSFPSFDAGGISLFAWNSNSNDYTEEAIAPEGSLSELLLPAGYVQIGRPDTGNFDAICFDLNDTRQNREYRIVRIDHEQILCNWRARVSGELWPSFIKFMDSVIFWN
jgi:hypothetical protein